MPLLHQFPSELKGLLSIIRHLRDKRKLFYFVLFHATLSTVPSSAVYVSPLLQNFPHWDISAYLINTASLGDSIASFCLVIDGKLFTDIPTLTLCISRVDTVPSSAIRQHIDSGLNED